MKTKICRKCNNKKDIKEFYVHKQSKDGHLWTCIDCFSRLSAEHRRTLPESRKAYNRKRRQAKGLTTEQKKAGAKYLQLWREKNRIKYASHLLVNNAIKYGKIVKKVFCEHCYKKEKLEGHHNDYHKPLEVIWLCVSCHRKFHGKYSGDL